MVELIPCDMEAFAEAFQGRKAQEGFSKDTEDEKKAIAEVRDEQVRQDSVGMAAASTDKAQDGYF